MLQVFPDVASIWTLPLLALGTKATGILGVVVALGGLIFIHELGHFMVAKWMGLPVETFSLGFGPRVLGFKWHETDIRLSALPLGGYVKLLGFNPEEPEAEDPHGFLKQPAWKRQLFYCGGILFNVLTTLVLLAVVGANQERITKSETKGVVFEVTPGSPAEAGGLKAGDLVRAVGPVRIASYEDWTAAIKHIQASAGKPVRFQLETPAGSQDLDLVPRDENGVGKLGFAPDLAILPLEWRPWRLADVGAGLRYSAYGTKQVAVNVLVGYGRLFSGKAKLKEVSGPAGIGKMAYRAAQNGLMSFLFFMAFLSMNLAILNALPIPFLDGGHMAMLAFERLRGKDLSITVKERILTAGFLLLASLMVLVVMKDILNWRH